MRLVALLLLLAACGGPSTVANSEATGVGTAPAATAPATASAPAGKRTDVSVTAFAKALESGAQVIDVRTPSEFAGGHVPGAVNLPISSFSLSSPVVADHAKDEPIYVICAVGGRSSVVADRLAEAGYQAVNVEGGTAAWQRAGLPVE